jgi:hypothetical protein
MMIGMMIGKYINEYWERNGRKGTTTARDAIFGAMESSGSFVR